MQVNRWMWFRGARSRLSLARRESLMPRPSSTVPDTPATGSISPFMVQPGPDGYIITTDDPEARAAYLREHRQWSPETPPFSESKVAERRAETLNRLWRSGTTIEADSEKPVPGHRSAGSDWGPTTGAWGLLPCDGRPGPCLRCSGTGVVPFRPDDGECYCCKGRGKHLRQ